MEGQIAPSSVRVVRIWRICSSRFVDLRPKRAERVTGSLPVSGNAAWTAATWAGRSLAGQVCRAVLARILAAADFFWAGGMASSP